MAGTAGQLVVREVQADWADRLTVLWGLRRWARGSRAEVAAVELLARLHGDGWCVDPARSWVRPCHRAGGYRVDGYRLVCRLSALPVQDQPVALFAALLVVGAPLSGLLAVVRAVPDRHLAMVVEVLLYAAGGPGTTAQSAGVAA